MYAVGPYIRPWHQIEEHYFLGVINLKTFTTKDELLLHVGMSQTSQMGKEVRKIRLKGILIE